MKTASTTKQFFAPEISGILFGVIKVPIFNETSGSQQRLQVMPNMPVEDVCLFWWAG